MGSALLALSVLVEHTDTHTLEEETENDSVHGRGG